ncbi:MAG: hypothetical protein QXU18_03835 [Thermoplasmatales archaeon]
MLLKKVKVAIVLTIVILSSATAVDTVLKDNTSTTGVPQNPLVPAQPFGTFEFLSEFTSGGNFSDYGWLMLNGSFAPPIVSSKNYYGEPSLAMSGGTTLYSQKGIVRGDQSLSFQFAINAEDGNGAFIITNASRGGIASISVNGGTVSVGAPGTDSAFSANTSTYPSNNGWMLISGNLFNYRSGNESSWRLQVFVDNTSTVFANISAPQGYSYAGIEISSSNGTVYFTNIIFTSYRIPVFLPGYNNMEGYGQGSGALVSLLTPFTILHANFLLYNWSVTRYSTLSFQINAMNLNAAENQTANGFFQLGVDLDPNGKIAPWYVGNDRAIAIYFKNHPSPDFMPGFSTPNGTVLGLTIQYVPLKAEILFQIIDYSVSNQYKYWNVSIPYAGTEFYAAYTQMETSYMNGSQLNDYRFNGTMFNISYGSSISSMVPLNSTYMLPFSINAPASWSLTYYSDQTAGYEQVD